MLRTIAAIYSLITAFSAGVTQAQEITTGIVEFAVGGGYSHYDSKRDIDNTTTGNMSLGMNFSRSYAAIVNYTKSYSEQKYTANTEVKIRRYHIDGYRFFNEDKALRPFVVLGFGNTDLTEDRQEKFDETQINAGIGLHYRLNPNWAVRGDIRNFYSIDAETNDQTLMMSIVYRFADGEPGQ
ncbi:MAG: porin family protein [Hahellaceae bacterium]|nr:porin family protein [Hahellaceae bacterium]MCP5212447.1 porin family protein [Hahellaceae bacterium]